VLEHWSVGMMVGFAESVASIFLLNTPALHYSIRVIIKKLVFSKHAKSLTNQLRRHSGSTGIVVTGTGELFRIFSATLPNR
jgi:hypothetical protein